MACLKWCMPAALLVVSAHASVEPSALLPPFDPSCSFHFSLLKPANVWTIPTEDAPLLHTMNSDKAVMEFKQLARAKLVKYEINEQLTFFCHADNLCFALDRLVQEGRHQQLILRDVVGKRYQAEVIGDSLEVSPRAMKLLEPVSDVPAAEIASLREKFLKSDVSRLKGEKLANYLTGRQLQSSQNAINDPENTIYLQSISEANLLLSRRLESGQFLTTADLGKLNWLANRGILSSRPHIEPASGAIRGTKNQVTLFGGRFYLMDMEGVQIRQGAGGMIFNAFLPSAEVPGAVEGLLANINKINGKVDPLAIFSLYKEFIHIHPFVDANGRTGRMLLNYMLLKGGLPPMRRPSESLYFSAAELVREYLKQLDD